MIPQSTARLNSKIAECEPAGAVQEEIGHRSQSLKTPDKNGDMFQAPPRRDYVSPVEPEGGPVDSEHGIPDNPNGPTPNGVGQICIPCPKLRGSNPPPAAFGGHPRQRGTQDGARIHLRQRGTQDGARIHLRPRVPVLAALKGRPRRAWGLARGSAARPG